MADNKELVEIQLQLEKIGDWKNIEDVRGILVQMGEELTRTGKLTQDFEAQFMRVINNLENASQKTGIKIAQNLEKSLQEVVANATAYSTQEITNLGNIMSVVGTTRNAQQAQNSTVSRKDLSGLRRSLSTLKGTNYGKISGSHGTSSKVEFGATERQEIQQQLENVTKKAKTATLVQLRDMYEAVEGVFGNDTAASVLSSADNNVLKNNLLAFQKKVLERIIRFSSVQLEQAGVDINKIINTSYAGGNQASKVRRANKNSEFLPQQNEAPKTQKADKAEVVAPVVPKPVAPKRVLNQKNTRFSTKTFTSSNGEEISYPTFSSDNLAGIRGAKGQILTGESEISSEQLSKMWKNAQLAKSKASTAQEKQVAEEEERKLNDILTEIGNYLLYNDDNSGSFFARSLKKKNISLGESLVEKLEEKKRNDRETYKGESISRGGGVTPQGKWDAQKELQLLNKGDPQYEYKASVIRDRERQERLKSYLPDMFEEDEDYISSQVRKWEKQADKEKQDRYKEVPLSEYAQEVRSNGIQLQSSSSELGTPNVDSYLKNITRFISEGKILGSIPNIDTYLTEEQSEILSQMQELSGLVDSDGFLSKFTSEDGDAKVQQQLLGSKLPDFLEKLSDKLIAFGDVNKDRLNKKVYQQLKFRIGQISEILSTVDSTGELSPENQTTFFNQFLNHTPYRSSNTFSGDARRSILSKQGIAQAGNYPTSIVPQYMTGGLPFYPNKDEGADMSNEVNRLQLLYQWVDSYYNQTLSVRDGQREFEELDNVDELNSILDMVKHIFDTLSPEGKDLAKGYLYSSGIHSTADGKLKDLYRFTESDASRVIQSIDKKKGNLSESELEQAKAYLKQIQEAFAAKSANLNSQDALAENEAIIKLLSDFTQESFTKEELTDIVNDEDVTDYIDVDTERIFADKDKTSVTRKELEEIVQKNIQEAGSTGVNQVFTDVSRLLGELEEKTVKEKIQPYLERYAKASTPSEKANITKEINSVFGKNSQEAEMWKTKKNALVSKLIEEQKHQQAYDAALQEQVDKASQKSVEELEAAGKITEQTNANVQQAITEATGDNTVINNPNGFLANYSKQYTPNGTKYTGVGVRLNGEDYLTVDLEEKYEQFDEEKRKAFLDSLQAQYEQFAEDEKQIFIRDLARDKKGKTSRSLYNDFFKKNQIYSSGIWEDANKNYSYNSSTYKWDKNSTPSAPTSGNVPPVNPPAPPSNGEFSTFNIENANVNIKNGNPVNINGENITQVTNGVNQNSVVSNANSNANVDDTVTFSPVKIGEFNADTHEYLNEQGERMFSITQLRDLLLHGNNPTFERDNSAVKTKLKGVKEGDVLTAEQVGMSEQDFNRHKTTIASGAKGNIFHEYIDAFFKGFSADEFKGLYGLDSDGLFAKLKEKLPEKLYKSLMENIAKEQTTLSKLGVKPEELTTGKDLVSYFNAMQKSGMTPTKFSEQRLGFAIEKGGKRYEVAATPDQIYGQGMVDNKTGYVGGYEAFQLMASKFGMKVNQGQAGFENLEGIDIDKLKLYVADVKDGTTQLIEYMELTADEFFNLVDRANQIKDGTAEPLTKEEQQLKMNRQLSSGRIIGEAEQQSTQQSTPDRKTATDYYNAYKEEAKTIENEKLALKEISSLRQNQLKSIKNVTVAQESLKDITNQLAQLDAQGVSQDTAEYQTLLREKKEQEDILKVEEERFASTQARVDVIKSGLKSFNAKREVGSLDAMFDINAKEATSAGFRDIGSKNISEESKQVLSSQKVAMNQYLDNLKQKMKYEEESVRLQKQMEKQTDLEKESSQKILDSINMQKAGNQAILNGYDAQTGRLNDIQLTKEQQVELEEKIAVLQSKHEHQLTKITNQANTQKGLFEQIASGFKQSLRSLIDYSLAYKVIGLIQQQFTNLVNVTKQLDAELVDIQIATGNTREETHDLLREYNDMADALGRTTQEVASASDDWLRAGYQGKEAAELTKASMELSTLGQIDASNATTYLISVLKGWRIEADEVSTVVDKLSAVDMQAAISAGDLAEAMSRANNVARLGGSDMNKYIGYITTVADATQKSAESVGESFKTVYSRFGNVAAGKFMASVEEQQSADYNEDEWSNLNDIETVLGSIGIKLRDTATSFRNIDDVMAEIGEKWEGFNDVTQNAIATAVAGVRQRENVVTLFENWGNVSKYEEIAANSYGTASEKMEAFSDSIEASQNRLTAAIEQWALFFKGEGIIKDFYDAITFVVKNIISLGVAFSALALMLHGGSVLETGLKGFVGLQTKLVNFASIFDKIGNNFSSINEGKQGFMQRVGENLSDNYDSAVISNLNKDLSGLSKSVSEVTLINARNAQQQLLNLDVDKQKLAMDFLNKNITEEQYLNDLYNLEVTKNNLTLSAEEEAELRKTIRAQNEYTLSLINGKDANEQAAGRVAGNLERYKNRPSAKDSAKIGGAMLGGMLIGSSGYGSIGELIGGDTGKIIGTMLGGMIGTSALKTISSAMIGTSGIGAALKAGLTAGSGLPIVGIGIALAGLIWKGIKSYNETKLKEAQEDFKKVSESYQNALGANTDVSSYSKLVKGVDSLGRNVSLTDDEYQQFLDTSNSLAKIFPELIVKTDDMGNSFVGMNGKVSDVTNSVNELTQALQKQADTSLLNDRLFKDNYNTAKGQYDNSLNNQAHTNEVISQIEKNKFVDAGLLSGYSDEEKAIFEKYGKTVYKTDGKGLVYDISEDDLKKVVGELNDLVGTYKTETTSALNSMSDEAKAIIRQDSDIDYYNLDSDKQDFLSNVGTSIQFNGDYTKWQSDIESAVEFAKQFLEDNPTYLSLLYDEQDTAKETQKVRMDLATKLKDSLPESMSYDDQKAIMLKIGFEYDPTTGSLTDMEDYLTKIQTEYSNVANGAIGKVLDNVTTDEAKTIYDYLQNGRLHEESSESNVVRALSNNALKNMEGNEFAQTSYAARMSEDSDRIGKSANLRGTLQNMAKNWATTGDDSALNQEIESTFGVLTDEAHNALVSATKNISEDIDNNDTIQNSIDGMFTTMKTNITSQKNEVVKIKNEEIFGDFGFDLGEDGIINTFKEIQNVLDDVSASFENLTNAQKEYNKNGKISLQTAVDLLAENSNYAQVLEFETDAVTGNTTAIKLKANAQEIMAKIQLEAIRNNIHQAITEKENEKATIENKLAILGMSQTELDNLDVSKDVINASNAQAKAFNQVSATIAGIGAALEALSKGEFSKISSAYSDAYDSIVGTVEEVTYSQKVAIMSEEEKEDAKAELESQLAEVEESLKGLNGVYDGLDTAITSGNASDFLTKWNEGNDTSSSDDGDTALDIAEARLNLIDKETEAIKALDKAKTLNEGRDTEYYKLERQGLLNKKAALEAAIKTDGKESERLGHLKDIQDVEVALRNLDDEELADKESWAETLGYSADYMKQIYLEGMKDADTYEEKIEWQKKYRDLLLEEYETRIKINDIDKERLDRDRSRLNPLSAEYENLTKQMQMEDEDTARELLAESERILTVLRKNRKEELDLLGVSYTDEEVEEWAKNREEYSEVMTRYYETLDDIVQLGLDQMNAKVDEIQRKISNLEKSKPNEWTNESDITDYRDSTVSYLNEQISEMKDFLNTTDNLTKEQVDSTVDKINEAILAVKQAMIDAQQAIKDHQDKIYDAMVWQVNEYIKDINEEKDILNKKYDEEIERLNKINNAHERTAKLIDLENKLADAGKEKKRVYREGEHNNALYKYNYIG